MAILDRPALRDESSPLPKAQVDGSGSRILLDARVGMLVAFVGLLGLHSWQYFPFFSDDALISLRYSQRLLEGHGLTWTSGPPVEGYTNLLWVLGAAALGRMGMDLILVARLLGILCTCGIGVALLMLPNGANRREAEVGKFAGIACLAMSATTAVWAIGGLEQPLVGVCLAFALLGAVRLLTDDVPRRGTAMGVGIAFALMCLTRPDSPLFVMTTAAVVGVSHWVRTRRIDWTTLLWVAGPPVLAYAGQTLFRHAYYGDWVPNTAHVKFKPSAAHLASGWDYARRGLVAGWPLYVAAVLSLWPLARQRQTAVAALLFAPAVLWLAYVVLIGGDIFPAFRHFTPVVVLSAFAIALGLGGILAPGRRILGPVVVASLAGVLWITQSVAADVMRARSERWEWAGRDLALTLRRAFAPSRPVIAVTAAGCLPYWSGFESIDMLGLNDAHIAHHPPKSFGTGLIGHELGDPDYIMRRRPDMIIYNVGTIGDPFETGRYLEKNPEFLAAYTPVTVRWLPSHAGEGTVWMNRYSSRIGYACRPDAITVPGYLVTGNQSSLVYPDSRGALETEVSREVPAWVVIPKSTLPAAPYRVAVAGEGTDWVGTATDGDGNLTVTVRAAGQAPFRLRAITVSSAG